MSRATAVAICADYVLFTVKTRSVPLFHVMVCDEMTDMHAKPVVDRSSVWEDDGASPDSTSRVPNIGDMDMSTVNRLLYQDPQPTQRSSRGLQQRRRGVRMQEGGNAGDQRGQRIRRRGGGVGGVDGGGPVYISRGTWAIP